MNKWLLSNDEFYSAITGCNDWLHELLLDNGIICEETANIYFIGSSTDFDIPDCPYCGFNDNVQYNLSNSDWQCKKCRCKYSIKTRRYFDNSKLPLTHWFRFCWIIYEHKKANSCFIARDLEVTQKTAWGMIATLKMAMNDNGHTFINGTIEFESVYSIMKLLMKIKSI